MFVVCVVFWLSVLVSVCLFQSVCVQYFVGGGVCVFDCGVLVV